jgi:hypothetical protein
VSSLNCDQLLMHDALEYTSDKHLYDIGIVQGPHKLLDDFVRSYFELEMCHDIKIRAKYNTVNVHLERP